MYDQPAMQFCQPAFSSGFTPNYNTCNQSFNPPPTFQYNGYPEIIGEGHVTSVISPDGSIQYLFVPTTQWWRQPSVPNCNPNFGNSNTQWNNNNAWFIRSAYPPMHPSSFQGICSPSFHGVCGSPMPCTSNSCIELHKPNYQFHNDGCTSTSDIHYFYPALRGSDWFRPQRASASCQTETSKTNSSCQDQTNTQVLCHLCKCSDGNKTEVEDMNCSSNTDTSTSNMSIEKCEETKYKTKNSSRKKISKERKHKCECYPKEEKIKEKPERMCYNSDSSIDKTVLTKSDDSSRKKKSKEVRYICACYPEEDKTKEKPVRMCNSSNSSDISALKKYNVSNRKKKSKKTKQKCECYPKEDKIKEKSVRMSYSSNSSADKIALAQSENSNRKKKVICKVTKVICKCNEPPHKVDKSCITCTEQSSNCSEEVGKETQTKLTANTGSMTDMNTVEKKPILKSSVTFCGDNESCFETPSCSCYSCSTSETEIEKRPCYSKRKKTN